MNSVEIAWTNPPQRMGRGQLDTDMIGNEHALLAQIGSYGSAMGYNLPLLLVIDYWIALKGSPFVVLFGPSGTGKTELVRLFAEALTQPFEDQYANVNMGGSGDRGEVEQLQDRFGWLKFVEMLETAASPANAGRIFFLCLDNLRPSDIETYFALLVQEPDTPGYRLALRGFPAAHWPLVPPNVVLTGTLDADTLPVLASHTASRTSGVYVQPQWLNSTRPPLRRRDAIAPVGLQRMVLSAPLREDGAALDRLNALLHNPEETLQLPEELAAIMWQTGLTYDRDWRNQTLRMVANSFSVDGRGLFVARDNEQNARFALMWTLSRQLMLRLCQDPSAVERLEALLQRSLATLPLPAWSAFDVNLA